MNNNLSLKRYEFYIVAAAILWGSISLFKNPLSDFGLSSTEISFMRTGISTVVFGFYMFSKNPASFKIKLRDLWCFTGTGAVSLFLFSLCYFKAMSLTTVGVSVALLYTSPVFVMLMSFVLFKEKITKNKILSLFSALLGCLFISGIFSESVEKINTAGIIFGLLSGFFYALYSIFGKLAIKRGYNSYTITFYTFLFATLPSVFMTDFERILPLTENKLFWLYSMGISLICTVFPYLFYTKGLLKVQAGKAAVIAVTEPVVGTFVGILAFSESMSIYEALGIVLILLCTVLLRKE